jgi:hypothetical protein
MRYSVIEGDWVTYRGRSVQVIQTPGPGLKTVRVFMDKPRRIPLAEARLGHPWENGPWLGERADESKKLS